MANKQNARSKTAALLYSMDLLRTVLFVLFLLRWTRISWLQLKGRGLLGTSKEFLTFCRKKSFGVLLRLPGVSSKIQKDVETAKASMEKKFTHYEAGVNTYKKLPAQGWSAEQVSAELHQLSEMKHTRWEDGLVSGAVYHGGKDLANLQAEAFKEFTVSNPIHPDVFPGVRKMEAEVVAMVLSMFNGPPGSAGCSTSGGTESILMACLSARERGRKEKGISEPEMIIPNTAHAAFRKAGAYFGIKVHLVDCPAPSHRVHVPSVARLVNSNTVLIVGSAPNYPHGIIDDISALSRLAVRADLCLHVDCCLGSFLMPYLKKAGFESELFDFALPGVTSISVDTHKYGFAPKGNSTVLYRNKKLRSYQYFICADWSGGVYGSPSVAGSRPGALIAGCWASMMNQGESGYITACHSIVGTAKRIEHQIRTRDSLAGDLSVIGRPLVSVVAFTSSTLPIYDIADGMSGKGWHLNALQDPPGIHVAVTLPIVPVADKLLADLEAVLNDVRAAELERKRSGKGAKGAAKGDAASLYGVAGSLPDKRIVVELAEAFLDTLYKV